MDCFFRNFINVILIIISFILLCSGNVSEELHLKEIYIHKAEVIKIGAKMSIGRTPEVCPENHVRDRKGVCRFKFHS